MTEIRRFLKPDITTSQDLSVGAGTALSFTTSIGRKFKLEKILFHASVAITENITITLDSVNGPTSDIVLRKKALTAAQDYVYTPEGEHNYQAGDEIKVECTAATDTGTIFVTIKTSEA